MTFRSVALLTLVVQGTSLQLQSKAMARDAGLGGLLGGDKGALGMLDNISPNWKEQIGLWAVKQVGLEDVGRAALKSGAEEWVFRTLANISSEEAANRYKTMLLNGKFGDFWNECGWQGFPTAPAWSKDWVFQWPVLRCFKPPQGFDVWTLGMNTVIAPSKGHLQPTFWALPFLTVNACLASNLFATLFDIQYSSPCFIFDVLHGEESWKYNGVIEKVSVNRESYMITTKFTAGVTESLINNPSGNVAVQYGSRILGLLVYVIASMVDGVMYAVTLLYFLCHDAFIRWAKQVGTFDFTSWSLFRPLWYVSVPWAVFNVAAKFMFPNDSIINFVYRRIFAFSMALTGRDTFTEVGQHFDAKGEAKKVEDPYEQLQSSWTGAAISLSKRAWHRVSLTFGKFIAIFYWVFWTLFVMVGSLVSITVVSIARLFGLVLSRLMSTERYLGVCKWMTWLGVKLWVLAPEETENGVWVTDKDIFLERKKIEDLFINKATSEQLIERYLQTIYKLEVTLKKKQNLYAKKVGVKTAFDDVLRRGQICKTEKELLYAKVRLHQHKAQFELIMLMVNGNMPYDVAAREVGKIQKDDKRKQEEIELVAGYEKKVAEFNQIKQQLAQISANGENR